MNCVGVPIDKWYVLCSALLWYAVPLWCVMYAIIWNVLNEQVTDDDYINGHCTAENDHFNSTARATTTYKYQKSVINFSVQINLQLTKSIEQPLETCCFVSEWKFVQQKTFWWKNRKQFWVSKFPKLNIKFSFLKKIYSRSSRWFFMFVDFIKYFRWE